MIRNTNQNGSQYRVYKNYYSKLYFKFHKTTLWSNTETEAGQYIPINLSIDTNNIQINVRSIHHSLCTNVNQFQPARQFKTLIEFIKNTKIWQQPLLESTTMTENIDHLTMNKSVYTICSDGGVRNSEAGIGIVTTAHGQPIMTNKVRIPPTFNETNSYRAEAFGIATAAATYYLIQQYKRENNLTQSENSLRKICDGKSVIDKVNSIKNVWTMTTKFFTSADADIITAIAIIIHKIRCQFGCVTLIHVKGHQDRNTEAELSSDAQLNVIADQLATESLTNRKIPTIKITSNRAELHINGQLVSAKRTQLIKKPTTP
jgi:hypothetical protein